MVCVFPGGIIVSALYHDKVDKKPSVTVNSRQWFRISFFVYLSYDRVSQP